MHIPRKQQDEHQHDDTDHIGCWVGEVLPFLPVGASLIAGWLHSGSSCWYYEAYRSATVMSIHFVHTRRFYTQQVTWVINGTCAVLAALGWPR